MALSNYSIDLNPGQVCDKLVAVGAYSADGYISYDGVEKAFPGIKFYDRITTTAATWSNREQKKEIGACIEQIKRLLSYGIPVPLHVDIVGNDGVPDHFVLAVAWDDMAKDFLINDPAWGDQILLSKRYHSPVTGIYGFVVLLGTPAYFPDSSTIKDQDIGVAIGKLAQAQKQPALMKQMVGETIDSFVR